MSYPLPGETVIRTLRNVEFGAVPPRDEPAPPEIAEYFRAMQSAWLEVGAEHQTWMQQRDAPSWYAWSAALSVYEHLHNHLLKVLRKHRDHCYTCDGCRFWLHTEAGGCRRETVRIEEV